MAPRRIAGRQQPALRVDPGVAEGVAPNPTEPVAVPVCKEGKQVTLKVTVNRNDLVEMLRGEEEPLRFTARGGVVARLRAALDGEEGQA